MIFENRKIAGKLLAEKLTQYEGKEAVIYALPRGGVTVASEIAKKLHLPLDIVLTKKIGHPFDPEFAICAVSESGILECGEGENGVDQDWLKNKVTETTLLLQQRRTDYKPERIPAEGKTAILVDDGIATGLTMMVAIREIKQQNPKEIVVAVPVAPPEVVTAIRSKVDNFIALYVPEEFALAVSAYYLAFPQVEDDEVKALIKESNENNKR